MKFYDLTKEPMKAPDELETYRGRWANLYIWPDKTWVSSTRFNSKEGAAKALEEGLRRSEEKLQNTGVFTALFADNSFTQRLGRVSDLSAAFPIPVGDS